MINEYGDDMQPGDIVHSARTTAPVGYLIANGAAVSRATYGNLFAALGTAYGAGDGATTFNLPDLRGEFIRGADQGRGVDAGRVAGSSQLDAFQGHTFSLPLGADSLGGSGVQNYRPIASANTSGAPISDGVNGAPRTATETRPRNVALLPLIKY
ncbi:hypothetical protein ACG97_00370 [Vogesella sp. EB]|nr:hypothetical protein ACG97_00370 [Vogesella sp. EB]